MINLIVAVTNNFCIGNNGDLAEYNKEDMNLFKQLTEFKTVIMGRKTFQSLPTPLKNRINVVLTNSPKKYSDCNVIYTTFEELNLDPNIEYWLIGGGEIYEKFLAENLVDRIYLSKFDTEVEGDVFFPDKYLKNFSRKYIKYHNTFKQEVYERIRRT